MKSRSVDRPPARGRGRPAAHLGGLRFSEQLWYGVLKGLRDGGPDFVEFGLTESRAWEPVQRKGIAGEPELFRRLVEAETAEEVRQTYLESPFWLNPEKSHKLFLRLLYDHAEQFVAGKCDEKRCPDSQRPTSRERLLRYLARVMAGIMEGRRPRTAVDKLGGQTHPGFERGTHLREGVLFRVEGPEGVEFFTDGLNTVWIPEFPRWSVGKPVPRRPNPRLPGARSSQPVRNG